MKISRLLMVFWFSFAVWQFVGVAEPQLVQADGFGRHNRQFEYRRNPRSDLPTYCPNNLLSIECQRYVIQPPRTGYYGHAGQGNVYQQNNFGGGGYDGGGYQQGGGNTIILSGIIREIGCLFKDCNSKTTIQVNSNNNYLPQHAQVQPPPPLPVQEAAATPKIVLEGVYVRGEDADAVRYVKMAYRRRSIMTVNNPDTAAKEAIVTLRIGDPRAVIHIEVTDLEVRGRPSRDFSASEHFTMTKDALKNEDLRLDAIAAAAEDAVAAATGIVKAKKEKVAGTGQ